MIIRKIRESIYRFRIDSCFGVGHGGRIVLNYPFGGGHPLRCWRARALGLDYGHVTSQIVLSTSNSTYEVEVIIPDFKVR